MVVVLLNVAKKATSGARGITVCRNVRWLAKNATIGVGRILEARFPVTPPNEWGQTSSK